MGLRQQNSNNPSDVGLRPQNSNIMTRDKRNDYKSNTGVETNSPPYIVFWKLLAIKGTHPFKPLDPFLKPQINGWGET